MPGRCRGSEKCLLGLKTTVNNSLFVQNVTFDTWVLPELLKMCVWLGGSCEISEFGPDKQP